MLHPTDNRARAAPAQVQAGPPSLAVRPWYSGSCFIEVSVLELLASLLAANAHQGTSPRKAGE